MKHLCYKTTSPFQVSGANIQVSGEALPNSSERVVTISGCLSAISDCIKQICLVMLEVGCGHVTCMWQLHVYKHEAPLLSLSPTPNASSPISFSVPYSFQSPPKGPVQQYIPPSADQISRNSQLSGISSAPPSAAALASESTMSQQMKIPNDVSRRGCRSPSLPQSFLPC